MPKAPYIPWGDQPKANWLDNLAVKLPTYEAVLGLTPADTASVAADAAMFNYIVDMQEAYKTFKQDVSYYKDFLRDGGPGAFGPLPVAPVLPIPPAPVQKGIFDRIRNMVGRIKRHSAYNQSMGEDMGIVGDEQTIDIPNLKPVLKSRLDAERPLIIWNKGAADRINIYVDRKDGAGFVFLATDSYPDYLDTFTLPAGQNSAVWDYKARYLIGDEPVGLFSDIISVTVTRGV
jgi:hypothetical protein